MTYKQWIKTDWLIDKLEWGSLCRGVEPNDHLAIGRIQFSNGIKVEVFVHKRTDDELIEDGIKGGSMLPQSIGIFVDPFEYSPKIKSNYDYMEVELILRDLKSINTTNFNLVNKLKPKNGIPWRNDQASFE